MMVRKHNNVKSLGIFRKIFELSFEQNGCTTEKNNQYKKLITGTATNGSKSFNPYGFSTLCGYGKKT